MNCRRKAGCPLLPRVDPAVLSALVCALGALVIECRVKLLRGRPWPSGQQHLRRALRALNQFPRCCLGAPSRLAQDRSSVSTEQYVPCAKCRRAEVLSAPLLRVSVCTSYRCRIFIPCLRRMSSWRRPDACTPRLAAREFLPIRRAQGARLGDEKENRLRTCLL